VNEALNPTRSEAQPTAARRPAADPVRLGVVGTGDWGRNLIRNLAAVGELRALADERPEALAPLRPLYPRTRFTTDPGELFADREIEAVAVATNSSSHYAVARAALEAGKDVLVEKPLAQSSEEAAHLVRLAAERRRVLMVGHLLIYHPAVEMLRGLLASGELGEIYYLYSQRVNLGKIRQDENALWSLGPHDVAVILDLLGGMPVKVSAVGHAYLQPAIEDVVFLHLEFPGGQIANVHLSWLDPHKLRRLTLVGARKMVVFDDMEATEKIRIFDKGVRSPAGGVLEYKDALTLRFGDILIPQVAMREPLELECRDFVEAVKGRGRPRADGRAGLKVVRVLEAAARSLARGGTPVELVPAELDPAELDPAELEPGAEPR
jgi:predicted dehydrogenase